MALTPNQVAIRSELTAIQKCAIFIMFVSSLMAIGDAQAQQNVYSRGHIKSIAASEVIANVERRLSAMGYTGIALQERDGVLIGSAVKAGRKAKVTFDNKGQLHIAVASRSLH